MSEIRATVIVVQSEGEWACYPAALYNSLANGSSEARRLIAGLPGDTDSERVQFLVAKHGSVPSTSYAATRNRYTADSGITSEDALEFLTDVLVKSTGPPVTGSYLERAEAEAQSDHLYRVHEMLNSSLEAEFLPVLVALIGSLLEQPRRTLSSSTTPTSLRQRISSLGGSAENYQVSIQGRFLPSRRG